MLNSLVQVPTRRLAWARPFRQPPPPVDLEKGCPSCRFIVTGGWTCGSIFSKHTSIFCSICRISVQYVGGEGSAWHHHWQNGLSHACHGSRWMHIHDVQWNDVVHEPTHRPFPVVDHSIPSFCPRGGGVCEIIGFVPLAPHCVKKGRTRAQASNNESRGGDETHHRTLFPSIFVRWLCQTLFTVHTPSSTGRWSH